MNKRNILTFLWLTPVILGTVDLLLWLIFRIEQLMLFGIIIIYIGISFLIIGLVLLIIFKIKKINEIHYSLFLIKLVSNLLICGLFIYIVILVSIDYTIQINNNTKADISNVVIYENNRKISIGNMKIDTSRTITTFVKQDGKIKIEYDIDKQKQYKTLEGYRLNSIGVDNEYDIE